MIFRLREAVAANAEKAAIVMRPTSHRAAVTDGQRIPWKAATWPASAAWCEPITMVVTRSSQTRWDKHGRAYGRSWNPSKERTPRMKRVPHMDFGTPTGDLIIDPWMQEALQGK